MVLELNVTTALAVQAAFERLAAQVPNPGPKPPPGVGTLANDWIGYFKWFALIAGVIGFILCGVMMMLGRRNRHALAVEGATGIPWTVAGLMVVSLAATITGAVL